MFKLLFDPRKLLDLLRIRLLDLGDAAIFVESVCGRYAPWSHDHNSVSSHNQPRKALKIKGFT
ncbi:MAG: hypothetical protein ACP5I4_17265 [Oceanipulchritudo sp.]